MLMISLNYRISFIDYRVCVMSTLHAVAAIAVWD